MSGKQRQAGEKDFLCYHWNNLLTHWLCSRGEQEAGAALTAFLTQEKRSTDLNAAAAELLAAQPEEKGPAWMQVPVTNTPAARGCCCTAARREPHITSTS